MKTLLSPFGLALMTILCFGACQQEKAPNEAQTGSDSTSTEAPLPIFTTIVNNLRMRDVPHLSGKTIEMIPAFTEVYSLERAAENIDTLMLRGVLYEEPWLQIEYKGKEGWVFGGGLREGKEQAVREKWHVEMKEEKHPYDYEVFLEFIGKEEIDKLDEATKEDIESMFYDLSSMAEFLGEEADDIQGVSVSFYEKNGARVPHGPFYISSSRPPTHANCRGLMKHGKLERLFVENFKGSFRYDYELRLNEKEFYFAFVERQVFREGTVHKYLNYTDQNGKKRSCSPVEKYDEEPEIEGDCDIRAYYPHYQKLSSLF